MTNNPTIDGVSREDLDLVLTYGCGTDASDAAWRLRALLDAPDICPTCDSRGAVCPDCKPEPEPTTLREPCETCGDYGQVGNILNAEPCPECAPAVERKEPVLLGYRIETEHGHHFKDSPTRGMGINCIELADRSEVAALQSTIAKLQARIAELESGRGEPVAWMCMSRDGYAQRCTKTDPEGFPVYRASSAPVAVMPDGWKMVPVEPTELMNRAGDESYSWNVAKIYKAMIDSVPAMPCLDATAALSTPK